MSPSAGLQTGQVLLRRERWGSALTGGGGEYQKAPPPQVLLQPTELFLGSGWVMGSSAAREGPSGQLAPWGRSHLAGLASLFWFSRTQPSRGSPSWWGLSPVCLEVDWFTHDVRPKLRSHDGSSADLAKVCDRALCHHNGPFSGIPRGCLFLPGLPPSCRARGLTSPWWVLGRCSHRKRQP